MTWILFKPETRCQWPAPWPAAFGHPSVHARGPQFREPNPGNLQNPPIPHHPSPIPLFHPPGKAWQCPRSVVSGDCAGCFAPVLLFQEGEKERIRPAAGAFRESQFCESARVDRGTWIAQPSGYFTGAAPVHSENHGQLP